MAHQITQDAYGSVADPDEHFGCEAFLQVSEVRVGFRRAGAGPERRESVTFLSELLEQSDRGFPAGFPVRNLLAPAP
jgi:hypothetical protein